MRTQVAIIGSGPSGLLLGKLLAGIGVDAVILERSTEEHVLERVRAGVLEQGTVDMLDEAGVGERLHAEGLRHDGFSVAFDGRLHRIDLDGADRQACHRLRPDRGHARPDREPRGGRADDASTRSSNVVLHGFDGRHARSSPSRRTARAFGSIATSSPAATAITASSRQSVPKDALTTFEKIYPFGWLGVLAEVPPVGPRTRLRQSCARLRAVLDALADARSRYYVQCARGREGRGLERRPLLGRIAPAACRLRSPRPSTIGPSFEKSIAPLRSFVAEPMRFGRLFLVGDAAHIVPPTGAKGLNLAASDVRYLFAGLREFYLERARPGSTPIPARHWRVCGRRCASPGG